MAQYENLKAAVADVIKQNGVGYITGERLQTQLFGIINNVGKYATFAGVVQPNGSPVAHDGPTFYLTGKPGTYANFGGVKTNGISVISNQSGAWVATRILDTSELAREKAVLVKDDTLKVKSIHKTYQTEAEALADKNPIDATTSLPLAVGQFVSIVNDEDKNGIYRISSISGDGTMVLELQGKLGDLSYKANHGYESNPKTLKEVDDEVVQLAGDMIHTKVGGKNIFNEFDGESGVVINNLGVLVPSSLWYTSPLIEWGEATQAIIDKSRSWAQYDEAGNVTSNWYNDSTVAIEQTLTKDALATHFRSSVDIARKDEVMANYGDILLPFEEYYLEITNVGNVPVKTYVSSKELIKEMILSESFMPQSATYTDGLIDSPFNVIWSDGRNGQITLTRNADNLITGLVAVYNGDESITATMAITRNTNNEVTKTEITF